MGHEPDRYLHWLALTLTPGVGRSEERRVGKECRL